MRNAIVHAEQASLHADRGALRLAIAAASAHCRGRNAKRSRERLREPDGLHCPGCGGVRKEPPLQSRGSLVAAAALFAVLTLALKEQDTRLDLLEGKIDDLTATVDKILEKIGNDRAIVIN